MTTTMLPIVWVKPLEAANEGDDSTLLGTLQIAGVDHHIEAFEVRTVNSCQEAVAPEAGYFDQLSEIVQGAMEEVRINGRRYVLLVTPFSS